jgi:putative hydrolase of HD superfamily
MNTDRLEQQMSFLKEIDKVKGIFRKSRLLDDSRYENDAEHAWHLAVMAIILAEHANTPQLNLSKVIKMVLIHDLVEIDAGDTFLYDTSLREKKKSEESRAADRIFGLLPSDQCAEFRSLWDEFEERATPEAKFAASLDRFEPCLQNANTQGHAWKKYGVSRQRVEAANKHIAEGSHAIWEYTKRLFAEADEKGYFPKKKTSKQPSETARQRKN